MKVKILILTLLMSNLASANLPYYPIQFPRDEGAHVSNIPYTYDRLIEWWYFNGLVHTKQGKTLAYDYAIFNVAINTAQGIVTKPMVHLQLMDLEKKKTYAASSDYTFNQGNFSTNFLDINLNKTYQLRQLSIINTRAYKLTANTVTTDNEQLEFNLAFLPNAAPLLIGGKGMLDMQGNTNSYYYTLPKLVTSGTITLGDEHYDIAKGESWMDHQWGDFNVDNYGWEWFSVRLDNGIFANIFLNIEFSTQKVINGMASIRLENGKEKFISFEHMTVLRKNPWHEPTRGIDYPQTFIINLPEIDLTIENNANFSEQAPHGYWEGYCDVRAKYKGKSIKGYSFTELVYSRP
jgi:predicted secreted hydrolase